MPAKSNRRPAVVAAAAPAKSARAVGLRYVDCARPGIARRRRGRGFVYRDGRGRPISATTRDRIRALAIPPAWTDVWICPDPAGHLQATGRDARGRKQYRYHPRWRAARDETKYGRMIAFAQALPRIRRRVERDLRGARLSRERVLAAVVRLLEISLIRVGNDEYARTNRSFGLTTIRDGHARISGSTLRFRFRGKSGKASAVDVDDARLARIVRKCRDLPGQELFQYVDATGHPQDIGSADVNAYLRELAGWDCTAKDFRTWGGTVLAARALETLGAADSVRQAKRNTVRAIERVADRLHNTVAVCRKSYVHPAVLDAYRDGVTLSAFRRRSTKRPAAGLRAEERRVLALLEQSQVVEAPARERRAARA